MSHSQIISNSKNIEKSQDDLQLSNMSADQTGQFSNTEENAMESVDYGLEPLEIIDNLPIESQLEESLIIGQLLIPELEMNVPVLEGTNNNNLSNGAATLQPGQVMGEGNYALATNYVQNEESLFTNIADLSPRQSVYITDKETVYQYEINQVSNREDIQAILDTSDTSRLQLVTLDEAGAYTVAEADYKYSYPLSQSDNDVINAFTNQEGDE